MTFKTLLLSNFALAIIGGLLLSWLSVPSWLAFVIGVALATAVMVRLNPSSAVSSSSDNEEDDIPHTTLYVGNLPYRANEQDVRDLFAQHGEVFDVRLMKDKRTKKKRGFGFVEMASKDSDRAISALADYEFMQRTLKVRLANEPKHNAEEDKAQF